MEVTTITKKEKKSIEVVNGNPIEIAGSFDLGAAFSKWKETARKYKTSDISPKPPQGEGGTKNPKQKVIPKDLLGQVTNHVTSSVARANSPNKGSTGIYTVLNKIEKEIVNKQIFTELDRDVIEGFINLLESFLTHETLNPQNIVFKRPVKFRVVKGKLQIPSKEKTEIFGHYLDDYFKARYPKVKLPTGYERWSSKERNTAEPPLYQAIYGGEMFPEGGLLEVLKDGLEKMKAPATPTLRKVSSDSLAQIPQIKSWVTKNAKRFYKDGKYNLTGFRNELNSQNFTGSENAQFKRLITAAITGQKLSSVKGKNVLSHPIPKFRVELLTNGAMANLIKNAYIRSPRAKAPNTKKDEVKKWFVIL